jgi:heptosyltransferase-2
VDRASKRLAIQGFAGPVLGIGLGSSRPTKCWAIERYAEVAVRWCRETGGSVVAFSGPGESARGLGFLRAADEVLRRATFASGDERILVRARLGLEAELDLRALASVLSRCSVFLGNDSGPRHLAVACGVPTVTLFGPEDPFEWHPYPKERHPRFFVESLACRKDGDPGMPPWCSLDVCVKEAHRCMTGIGVDAVLDECKRVAQERGA